VIGNKDRIDAMTDATGLEQALRTVAGARVQAVRRAADGSASVVVDAEGLDDAARQELEGKLMAAAAGAGVQALRVGMSASRRQRRIIAVGSGKGGVGKSTLSANLAIALHRLGRPTGLVDADIHGPSQARLFATEDQRPEAKGNKLTPVMSRFGVPMLSMAHLVRPGQPIAWRGPMAGNALGQLIDAEWGNAEVIVVDLPPGTGDVQLTMLQKHKPAGAVIVSTPQDLALIDATRAIGLFEQGGVPLIGMVENMAGYLCPHCGQPSDPFGNGGAEAAAKTGGLPFLGRIPLAMAIRQGSDAGDPPAAGEGPLAEAYMAIARQIADWLDRNG
jgi:ATP-binding protein involved in chromosome partitioning